MREAPFLRLSLSLPDPLSLPLSLSISPCLLPSPAQAIAIASGGKDHPSALEARDFIAELKELMRTQKH